MRRGRVAPSSRHAPARRAVARSPPPRRPRAVRHRLPPPAPRGEAPRVAPRACAAAPGSVRQVPPAAQPCRRAPPPKRVAAAAGLSRAKACRWRVAPPLLRRRRCQLAAAYDVLSCDGSAWPSPHQTPSRAQQKSARRNPRRKAHATAPHRCCSPPSPRCNYLRRHYPRSRQHRSQHRREHRRRRRRRRRRHRCEHRRSRGASRGTSRGATRGGGSQPSRGCRRGWGCRRDCWRRGTAAARWTCCP